MKSPSVCCGRREAGGESGALTVFGGLVDFLSLVVSPLGVVSVSRSLKKNKTADSNVVPHRSTNAA